MTRHVFAFPATFAALQIALLGTAHAEWKPQGPITLHIGFKVGGGTDIQARLIGGELAKKHGWKFIFKNIDGKGGANLARAIKAGSKDGLTIAMAVTSTFTYTPLIARDAGYTAADADYIISTAPSQMGLAVRRDSGWKTLADVAAAARLKPLKFAVMSPRLGDAAHLISRKYGIKFNSIKAKGGRGVLDGLTAKTIDLGFIAGLHANAVRSGDLINIASAETTRLAMSPDAPTLIELGLPYSFGATFIMFAPKDTNPAATGAMATAVKAILSDDKSKAREFIMRTYGEPPLKTGAELNQLMTAEVTANRKMVASVR